MEKKEILALIAAVSAVMLLIFIMTKVRGEEEQTPAGSIYVDPAQFAVTDAPETDIWDILHAMNATTAEPEESETVAVTAIDNNGEIYVVTDEQGNAQTEIAPAEETPADADAAAETAPADGQQGEVPVINYTPGQQTPAEDQREDPYFVVVPADQ